MQCEKYEHKKKTESFRINRKRKLEKTAKKNRIELQEKTLNEKVK